MAHCESKWTGKNHLGIVRHSERNKASCLPRALSHITSSPGPPHRGCMNYLLPGRPRKAAAFSSSRGELMSQQTLQNALTGGNPFGSCSRSQDSNCPAPWSFPRASALGKGSHKRTVLCMLKVLSPFLFLSFIPSKSLRLHERKGLG